ncbi:hypothetical protein [Methylogaea oryzae]|uniref:Uncharacterized protein n=1 Tax=Methylogaea oryzae TaxID=1295382 RepID=A0A8D4VMB3_9GAMM|nr:hypothetical protein [Methylogaea oryzae]BBL69737.1 hypothetical protein MoryE10_03430 [Methylogaea oryzae]
MFAALASRFVIPMALLLAGIVAGAAWGYRYADAQGQAALANLQRQQADQHAQAEALLRAELEQAHEYGEGLSAQLADAQSRQTVKTIEVIRRVPIVTSNRVCLSPDAVRLLNGVIATAGDADAVPQAAGGAAGEAAAAAASDRDVAGWIAEAAGVCNVQAAQLAAVIDWHEHQAEALR